MRKDGRKSSVVIWSAVALGAVGIGVVVAFLAGYLVGHFTTNSKTTTVSFAAAPASHGAESQESSEPEAEGSEPTVEEEAPERPQQEEAPAGGGEAGGNGEAGGEEAALATGKGIVESTCAGCHTLSEAGASGTVGPNLDELKPSQALVEHQVANGGGGMPAFKGTLSSAEIEAVAEYVSKVAGTGNSAAG